MPRRSKSQAIRRLTHNPETIRATLEKVAQFLSGPVDASARRDLVWDMLCERYRPSQIVRALTAKGEDGKPICGVAAGTIRDDIQVCREMGAREFKAKTTEQRMTEAVDSLTRTIKKAHDMGDLQAAIAGEKLLASLMGLLRSEEFTQANLGVVIVPASLSREEWEKEAKKV